MPTNIQPTSNFYVQNENDLNASGNNGATVGTATRLLQGNPDLGHKAETQANSDTGTFSLIQLFKRFLAIKLSNYLETLASTVVDSRVNVRGELSGFTELVGDTITRPNNTTNYSAGDSINETTPKVLQFPVGRVNGGSGVLIYGFLSNTQLTNHTYYLWLYTVAPSPVADNAPINITDNPNFLGVIRFDKADVISDGASNSIAYDQVNLAIPFKCQPNDNKIYGLLSTTSPYTPTANALFRVKLGVEQN